jgi:hypothetical protein
MLCRNLIAAVALMAVAWPPGNARAWDDTKYPNWKGQWRAVNPGLGGQIIKGTSKNADFRRIMRI